MTMRRLMLLRHAKSDWSLAGQRDIDRPLNTRGRAVAPQIGRYMAQHGLVPDRAIVSTAVRTRETWSLASAAFEAGVPADYERRIYEAPVSALLDVIHAAAPQVHTLLLVGHNPGMQQLASTLMGSGDTDGRHRLMEKYPTAALAVLDFAVDRWDALGPSSGRLDRFVTPRALNLDTTD